MLHSSDDDGDDDNFVSKYCFWFSRLPKEDSDEDQYPLPPAEVPRKKPKPKSHLLSCIQKQDSEENPLVSKIGGASPKDLAQAQVA